MNIFKLVMYLNMGSLRGLDTTNSTATAKTFSSLNVKIIFLKIVWIIFLKEGVQISLKMY